MKCGRVEFTLVEWGEGAARHCAADAVNLVGGEPRCAEHTPTIRPITEADELESVLEGVALAEPYRPHVARGLRRSWRGWPDSHAYEDDDFDDPDRWIDLAYR